MKLLKRHKEILLNEKEEIQNSGIATLKGGYVWINEDYKGFIIENLQLTNFIQMYPHIMVMLHDEGLIDIPEEAEKLKWFFNNQIDLKLMSVGKYNKWKIWVNSLYGRLIKQTKGHLIMGLMTKYQYLLYDEILENNPEHIVYIDTDQIISINQLNLLDCPLPYSTENLTLGVFKAKKRYVIYDVDIKAKGYPFRMHEEVKRELQSKIREIKLDKIFP